MLARMRYTINQWWKYRLFLKQYPTDPQRQILKIIDLKPERLQQLGILALALDYDGVLASHAEPTPREEVIKWLTDFVQSYSARQIYILSNRPTACMQDFFQKKFPDISFIIVQRKKPYPDGLESILQQSGVLPSQLLLVDDRLGTGILATIIAGTRALWVTAPYTDFFARPFSEAFFMGLRFSERLACKII
jgi:predicted HAD superfamily phosphohydrolase YqeG